MDRDKQVALSRECSVCVHRRSIPGDCHIRCANPDPDMIGHEAGVRQGWFVYPINFDPVWKAKACANFEAVQS